VPRELLLFRDRVRGLRVNAERICRDLDPYAIQAAQKREEGLRVVVRKDPAYPQGSQCATFDLDG
jgi:hypothetical protein